MENDSKTVDRIYLKPNAFDIVMEVVAGLLLLFLWGIALGKFVFPESYTDRFDYNHAIILTIASSLFAVLYYLLGRSPVIFVRNKISKENAERLSRICARLLRILFIAMLVFITGYITKGIVPLEIIHTLWQDFMIYTVCSAISLLILMSFLIWYFTRPGC